MHGVVVAVAVLLAISAQHCSAHGVHDDGHGDASATRQRTRSRHTVADTSLPAGAFSRCGCDDLPPAAEVVVPQQYVVHGEATDPARRLQDVEGEAFVTITQAAALGLTAPIRLQVRGVSVVYEQRTPVAVLEYELGLYWCLSGA